MSSLLPVAAGELLSSLAASTRQNRSVHHEHAEVVVLTEAEQTSTGGPSSSRRTLLQHALIIAAILQLLLIIWLIWRRYRHGRVQARDAACSSVVELAAATLPPAVDEFSAEDFHSCVDVTRMSLVGDSIGSSAAARYFGTWMLSRNEGDMEAFLTDCGVPWHKRKLAKGFSYGAGRVNNSFSCQGDTLLISQTGPMGTFTQRLLINGIEQPSVTLSSGEPCIVTPSWDGDTLVCKMKDATLRRRIVGDEICGELSSAANGISVRQYFKKQ